MRWSRAGTIGAAALALAFAACNAPPATYDVVIRYKNGFTARLQSKKFSLDDKLLAEIKMLRWMQFSLNNETKKADSLRQSNEITEVALLRRARELEGQQRDIRGIASKLHGQTCEDCVAGIH